MAHYNTNPHDYEAMVRDIVEAMAEFGIESDDVLFNLALMFIRNSVIDKYNGCDDDDVCVIVTGKKHGHPRTRGERRKNTIKKIARRTNTIKDDFGCVYSSKGHKIAFKNGNKNSVPCNKLDGKLRTCIPDGHTERLYDYNRADRKRSRQQSKRDIDNQLYEDYLEKKALVDWLNDFLTCEYDIELDPDWR